MKTKQRIINQAIASYNMCGVANVSIREIAKVLKISHGNLEYHFKSKEVLLLAIYKQMRKDISLAYEEPHFSEDPFQYFNQLFLKLEELDLKYLFFSQDILEICRNYSLVDIQLRNTFDTRRQQMADFFKTCEDQGYFKKEAYDGAYFKLQHTIRILVTFWNSQKEVFTYMKYDTSNTLSGYIWELLKPHMTNKGLMAYSQISTKRTKTI